MVRAVKGLYKDGRVELGEIPAVSGSAPVVVVFLEDQDRGDSNPAAADAQRRLKQDAARSLIQHMGRRYHLGQKPYERREELYDRGNGS
jgi:hypothetical protein